MSNIWLPEEIATLKREYRKHGSNLPELLVRHSKAGIRSKAERLGISKQGKGTSWTPKHIEILHANYSEFGSYIPDLLAEYTNAAIRAKARRLGLKYSKHT